MFVEEIEKTCYAFLYSYYILTVLHFSQNMKQQIFFLTLSLVCFLSFSQNAANWWYFGQNAGLDFSSGSPVAVFNGQLKTSEGCATISDNNGNLLFYTDGVTAYNNQHTAMPNGNGLMGNSSMLVSLFFLLCSFCL